jgi:hypothetical protein
MLPPRDDAISQIRIHLPRQADATIATSTSILMDPRLVAEEGGPGAGGRKCIEPTVERR